MDDQEKYDDLDGSFFGTVKLMAESIDLCIQDLKTLPKQQLKKQIKNKLNERMKKIVRATIPKMKKMRFITEPTEFSRKSYIGKLRGNEAVEALRLKLNMVVIYGNYHGDITLNRLCPHCESDDDSTEHLLDCPVLESSVTSQNICNDDNIQTWKQVLEIQRFNIEHRADTASWLKKFLRKSQSS